MYVCMYDCLYVCMCTCSHARLYALHLGVATTCDSIYSQVFLKETLHKWSSFAEVTYQFIVSTTRCHARPMCEVQGRIDIYLECHFRCNFQAFWGWRMVRLT